MTGRVITWGGLLVVLAAAAVLSFAALRDLAESVRIHTEIAWLLPIAVDAGAAVSCSAWLARGSGRDVARFAGRLTWALLALTVAGNAVAQGMAAAGLTPPWWVAVLVGAIAPAVVGGTVHLAVLMGRTPGAVTPVTHADDADHPDRDAGVTPHVVPALPDETPEERTRRQARARQAASRARKREATA